ncbi:DNA repair metallo-beta-lactamase-domain-containing protein [Cytidiella melzeri]|nr:DNA repair metallo-beta-lactamase-domain-containing protein [Cytidiella melzeri]
MAKKRKETTQSATLHNFFQRTDPNAPLSKRPRLSPITPRNIAKKPITVVSPAEIIVIDDSDSDDGATPIQASARTTQIPAVREISPCDREQSSGSTRIGHLSFGQPILLVDNEPSSSTTLRGAGAHGVPSYDAMSNGDDVLIFNTATSAQESAPYVNKGKGRAGGDCLNDPSGVRQSNIDMGFGEPMLLLDSGMTSPPLPATAQSQDPVQTVHPRRHSSTAQEQSSENPADVWDTGDDETDNANVEAAFAPDDNVDEQISDWHEQRTNEDTAAERCPICSKQLSGMSYSTIQDHVNACIDEASTTTTTLASDSPEPKPLRPLSAPKSPSVAPQKPDAPLQSSKDSGAFSVLMTSYKENEAWKEAAVAEDRNFRPTKANGGRRKAPFYKVMQGMPIAVDAFRYGSIPGVTAYFLTHAHSDHYTNLSASWKSGPIYCSEGTANLILHMLGVGREWVHPLPMDVATVIPDTGGVACTLIEANHCPGSCLFLFEGRQTVNAGDSSYKSPFVGSGRSFRYLHCGDFRASPQHVNHPAVKGKRMDHVYLDTTYLDPKYCFPPQSQVIMACAELARRLVAGELTCGSGAKHDGKVDEWFVKVDKPKLLDGGKPAGKTLVVVGTYSIGKERIVKAIAKALQTKVYCDPRKTAILRCQSDPELDALLTSDPLEATVHLLPLGTIACDKLKIYLERWKGHFSKAIGFRPTGWTFSAPSGTETLPAISAILARSQAKSFTYANLSPNKNSTSTLQMYGVPYSEHSSFFELTCFALSLDWGRMIATVNVGSETSRGKMSKWVERWEAEKKKRVKVEIVPPRHVDYW